MSDWFDSFPALICSRPLNNSFVFRSIGSLLCNALNFSKFSQLGSVFSQLSSLLLSLFPNSRFGGGLSFSQFPVRKYSQTGRSHSLRRIFTKEESRIIQWMLMKDSKLSFY